jgi:hypothetical protein
MVPCTGESPPTGQVQANAKAETVATCPVGGLSPVQGTIGRSGRVICYATATSEPASEEISSIRPVATKATRSQMFVTRSAIRSTL